VVALSRPEACQRIAARLFTLRLRAALGLPLRQWGEGLSDALIGQRLQEGLR
jgi:hypothetical protein